MRNFRARLAFVVALIAAASCTAHADAEQPSQGFAVERFYPSAAGAGWFVMDALDMSGGLGGAIALSGGYSHAPLRTASADGAQHVLVVSDQSFVTVGFAATYKRYRLHLDLNTPLAIGGTSGTVSGYQLTAPSVRAGNDSFADVRIGADVRLVGGPKSAFRLGAGVQLFVPSGTRADYVTDETYRAMGRLLFAGDAGGVAYAGQIGVHIRPLDDSPAPGSPQGSELLFGVAAGRRLAFGADAKMIAIVGPEVFGETAFRSFLGTTATGLEALLSGRIEGAKAKGAQLRVKLGAGAGLNPHFGAPEWRLVFAIELFDRGIAEDVPTR